MQRLREKVKNRRSSRATRKSSTSASAAALDAEDIKTVEPTLLRPSSRSSIKSTRSRRSTRHSSRSFSRAMLGPTEENPAPEFLGETQQERTRKLSSRKTLKLSSSSRDFLGLGHGFGSSASFSSVPSAAIDAALAGSGDGSRSSSPAPFVCRGALSKKGVVNVGWKKRMFVLTEKNLNYFVEDKEGSLHLRGSIDLTLVTHVDQHKQHKFCVHTPARMYKLMGEDDADRERWMSAIRGAVDKQTVLASSRARSRSRARTGSDVFDPDLPEMRMRTYKHHEPAQLNAWETWNAFEVAAWLDSRGFGEYSRKIFDAGVTGDKLESLSTVDLKNLGVEELGDQLKILRHVKMLTQEEAMLTPLHGGSAKGFES